MFAPPLSSESAGTGGFSLSLTAPTSGFTAAAGSDVGVTFSATGFSDSNSAVQIQLLSACGGAAVQASASFPIVSNPNSRTLSVTAAAGSYYLQVVAVSGTASGAKTVAIPITITPGACAAATGPNGEAVTVSAPAGPVSVMAGTSLSVSFTATGFDGSSSIRVGLTTACGAAPSVVNEAQITTSSTTRALSIPQSTAPGAYLLIVDFSGGKGAGARAAAIPVNVTAFVDVCAPTPSDDALFSLQMFAPVANAAVTAGSNLTVGTSLTNGWDNTTRVKVYLEDACGGAQLTFTSLASRSGLVGTEGWYFTLPVPATLAPGTYRVRAAVVAGKGVGAKTESRAITVNANPCAALASSSGGESLSLTGATASAAPGKHVTVNFTAAGVGSDTYAMAYLSTACGNLVAAVAGSNEFVPVNGANSVRVTVPAGTRAGTQLFAFVEVISGTGMGARTASAVVDVVAPPPVDPCIALPGCESRILLYR